MATTSTVTKIMRPLRIIALPLTRPTPSAQRSTSRLGSPYVSAAPTPILTHYHFEIKARSRKKLNSSSGDESASKSNSWLPEEGVVRWTTGKASQLWSGFGKAKEGSWKLRVYQAGERLVDRMDFEELALKGIDPSLGPSITQPDISGQTSTEAKPTNVMIPLLHPPSIQNGSAAIEHLKSMIVHRGPRHRKGFYMWMIIAPFTAPFMIIPIIPNLPFFFCVWRSWSHYRAYRASQYLESLLDSGAIVPQASAELDKIYAQYAPPPASNSDVGPTSSSTEEPSITEKDSSTTPSSDTTPEPERLLLTRDAVPVIIETLDLKPSAGSDLYRAVEQARIRVRDGRA